MKRTLLVGTLSLFSLAAAVLVGVWIWLAVTVDTEADARLFEASRGSRTTRLYYNAARGEAVYMAKEWESERLHGAEDAVWCTYEDIPKRVTDAFLAAEDHRFFSHNGVDWLRTAKAVLNQIFHFEGRFGGSTVTQQLVKNITGESEQTPKRKLRESYRALAIERKYTKEEILELYLNIVPMGDTRIGIFSGAAHYFDKEPSELSLTEAAALAALINAPARYDPREHPEENRARRTVVLEEMRQYGMISDAEYREAVSAPLVTVPDREAAHGQVLSWYTETVIDDVLSDLTERCGYSSAAAKRLLYSGGLEIYTLVDLEVQRIMEGAFSSFSVQDGVGFAGAVIDPKTGDILGIVGAAGEKKANRLMNYATTPLPPGSAIKPLSVYAPALDAGLIDSATVFDDVPLSFLGEEMRPWPSNSPNSYSGLCDLGTAIAASKNTVAVKTLRLLGKENSYGILSRSLGFSHLVRTAVGENGARLTDVAEAPLALGQLSYGVTVRELTSAYTTLAGDGQYREGRTYLAVYDKNGNLILKNEQKAHRVFAETTASIMTKQLERVISEGTAKGVRLPGGIPVAGKTGTTTEGRDKWFLGYSPYYLCGIWCGSKTETVSVAGKPQLAIFNAVMGELHRHIANEGNAITSFPLAEGVYECRFCRDGGGLMTVDCMHDPRGPRTTVGWFTAANIPRHACSVHVGVLCGEDGGVVMPSADSPFSGEGSVGLRRFGLLSIKDRSFPREVIIEDAQYVYRTLGNTPVCLENDLPFFSYAIPENTYVGRSKTKEGKQFNSAYRPPEEQDPFFSYSEFFG